MCNACEEIQVRQILSLFSAQTNPIGSNGGEGPLVSAALIQKAHLVSLFPALESWERTPHPCHSAKTYLRRRCTSGCDGGYGAVRRVAKTVSCVSLLQCKGLLDFQRA